MGIKHIHVPLAYTYINITLAVNIERLIIIIITVLLLGIFVYN